MDKCEHRNIVMIHEIPTDGVYPYVIWQNSKKYVICDDCGVELPINNITMRTIEVPISEINLK